MDLKAAGAASGSLHDAVEIAPHAVKRLGHHLGVAQSLAQQLGALAQHELGDFERLLRVALLDWVREAILEIGFMRELREVNRKGFGQRPHPVDRHHLDGTPGAEGRITSWPSARNARYRSRDARTALRGHRIPRRLS